MPASDSASAATKALAKAKIPHVLHSYDHDPSNHHFGDEGAAKLGFDPSIMLKPWSSSWSPRASLPSPSFR